MFSFAKLGYFNRVFFRKKKWKPRLFLSTDDKAEAFQETPRWYTTPHQVPWGDQGQVSRRLGGCQDANLAVKSAVRTVLLQYKLQTYGYTLVKRTENPPEKFARERAR